MLLQQSSRETFSCSPPYRRILARPKRYEGKSRTVEIFSFFSSCFDSMLKISANIADRFSRESADP
jgi:hypothetical protein